MVQQHPTPAGAPNACSSTLLSLHRRPRLRHSYRHGSLDYKKWRCPDNRSILLVLCSTCLYRLPLGFSDPCGHIREHLWNDWPRSYALRYDSQHRPCYRTLSKDPLRRSPDRSNVRSARNYCNGVAFLFASRTLLKPSNRLNRTRY